MRIARRSIAPASRSAATLLTLLCCALPAPPQAAPVLRSPQDLVRETIDNENAATARHEHWEYLSNERSGRTGGHLWTERVVETAPGRVRLLLAEDGQPLTGDRLQKERDRLAAIERDPTAFIKHESGARSEEKRIRQMLDVLPKDFLFENILLDNGVWTLNFRPNPAYVPSGIEERVLHAMAGRLVIDAQDLRLIHMDFHLTQDVPIGFGLLADVRTGTDFVSDRQRIDGHWHTLHVLTQVRAKAILFKSVDLNIDLNRSQFQPLDHELSVPEAAALLLR
jgi:hypothetical protein